MDRTICYQAGPEATGLYISQFLRRKGFSRQDLVRLKYSGEVRRNHIPAMLNERLSPGDTVETAVRETECSDVRPVRLPIRILFEDEDIVVLDKPAGMPVHPSRGNRDNTLANALSFYYEKEDSPFVFRCCNRLDRDTSGVIVVAKNVIASSILSEMGVRREISREYLGIVKGRLPVPCGVIDVPIGRKSGSIIERVVDRDGGESARTHYAVVCERNGHSLVRLKLETGRTHQIRIHLKYLGYPLVGDYLYNPDMEWIARQALHSWRMTFRHPVTGGKISFTAPLPQDMGRVLEPKT